MRLKETSLLVIPVETPMSCKCHSAFRGAAHWCFLVSRFLRVLKGVDPKLDLQNYRKSAFILRPKAYTADEFPNRIWSPILHTRAHTHTY